METSDFIPVVRIDMKKEQLYVRNGHKTFSMAYINGLQPFVNKPYDPIFTMEEDTYAVHSIEYKIADETIKKNYAVKVGNTELFVDLLQITQDQMDQHQRKFFSGGFNAFFNKYIKEYISLPWYKRIFAHKRFAKKLNEIKIDLESSTSTNILNINE